ncbi:MAG: sigma-54-dependent transcriptional regulator [Kiritimatiellia bacterium]
MTEEDKITLLIVDDEKNTRESLGRALKRQYRVFTAESAETALSILSKESVDLMLSDIRMPGEDGLSLLKTVRQRYPSVLCILLTAYGSIETSVEAMKSGAYDFLTKPVNLDQLDIKLDQALKTRKLENENRELRKRLDDRYGFENIIGTSEPMQALFDTIRQVSPTQANVLIQGASGTGKELVARAIHQLSSRSEGPFVAVHCAALSPTLLESELFGHEKGAFTGAVAQSKGRFELANGGTLFLDEISEIDLSMQVKLLRVLETRTFERVGGEKTLSTDIRVVAATNRNLKEYVAEGKFREDLYYRLNIVDIRMPLLSERKSDIPLLCAHFIKDFSKKNNRDVSGIEPAAMALLQAYPWPGNVRELRNIIERMIVLSHGNLLTVMDVPANIRDDAQKAVEATGEPNRTESLAQTEKRKILAALEAAGGNRSRAAVALGISRRTLHRKLAAWGITGADGKAEPEE